MDRGPGPASEAVCAHCLGPCGTAYVCSECHGQAICARCAKEAGLFGLAVILEARAAAARTARLQAIEAQWRARQGEARLRGGR
jgi:hypothetical protein